jgi:tetratricopeptide (TPR) repeat protein
LALQDFEAASNNLANPFQYESRAMFWHGLAEAKLGEQQAAIRSYTRALRGAPDFVLAYLNRGLAYFNVGRYDRAIEDFNQVLRRDPQNASARQYRGLAEQRHQLAGG